MNEARTNQHGVEISARHIFRWAEFDTVRWNDNGIKAQMASGEHMHLIRAAYPPGSTYVMHTHPHEQFSLLLSGRIRLTVGEETREIGPGDGWYAPAGVPHGGDILGKEKAVFIDVYSPATPWILGEFATGKRIPRASPGADSKSGGVW